MLSAGVSSNRFPERRFDRRGIGMQDPITSILERYKTLTIVGLSSKPSRPSHGVASYMKAHGYRVLAVNPNEASVFGEKAYASLSDIPFDIDVVANDFAGHTRST